MCVCVWSDGKSYQIKLNQLIDLAPVFAWPVGNDEAVTVGGGWCLREECYKICDKVIN